MSSWVVASAIVSPLGFTTEQNYEQLRQKISGLSIIEDISLSPFPICAGRIIGIKSSETASRFEQICLKASLHALGKISLAPERTIFLLSTTKGNISSITNRDKAKRLELHESAQWLCSELGLKHSLVVSNACVSGVMAMIVASRFLESGKYDHALIVGADELSQFVISGFESLHALSASPCKPFDVSRNGINLGEAAGAVLMSTERDLSGHNSNIRISGGGLSNDANHISGPSRTGDELRMAIDQALDEANLAPSAIDFISAHGTATVFNDEMEAKAFAQAGLAKTPLNSLKGYFGHTLGAAGIIESIISIESLLRNEVIASKGFENSGVTSEINVCREMMHQPIKVCLKTASGFGGCNAAIIIQKENI